MDKVAGWVKVAGWFRIVFGVLEIVSLAGRDLLAAREVATPEADALVGLGLGFDVAIGMFGVIAGVLLFSIAGRIRRRESFAVCVAGLTLLGVLAPCDCGWMVSAPVCVYSVVRLVGAQAEFH